MTIWYSKKPILPGAGKKHGDYFCFTADTIPELRSIISQLDRVGEYKFYTEDPKRGQDVISRKGGRPVVIVHNSAAQSLAESLEAIEVPDGYLQILIYLLKREYVRLDPRCNPEEAPFLRYFRTKIGALIRELHLGKIKTDGTRDIPDAIRFPEDLDDTTESDEQAYVERTKRRVIQIRMLNLKIEKLSQEFVKRPVVLSREPSPEDQERYVPERKKRVRQQPDLNPSLDKPWLKMAREKGWSTKDLADS